MRQIKDFKTMKERKSVHNCRVGSLLWKLEEEAQWTWVYIGEFQFPLPVLCPVSFQEQEHRPEIAKTLKLMNTVFSKSIVTTESQDMSS